MAKKNKNNNTNAVQQADEQAIEPVVTDPIEENTPSGDDAEVDNSNSEQTDTNGESDPVDFDDEAGLPVIPDGAESYTAAPIEYDGTPEPTLPVAEIPPEAPVATAVAVPATDPVTITKPEEKKDEAMSPKLSSDPVPATRKPKKFKAGQAIKLVNEPVYNVSGARKPIKSVSGVYYIYDDTCNNGRYRITEKRANCRQGIKFIVGYIDAK